ncbi:CBASS cGAMP-activated phospholipase [Geobacter benzoatilyticus]|uniref:Patatin-like phospholipase family protein n=1 Tax=Geobacter benzoatilyticus TaxID=2815309 RepID=A0ABX7Q764_9BACT|nr:CBASS cGAMP-activated phospholipase [Geobacter benzoatilyticus]QSV46910.1 patatin-like phospholipase family protein [Geobacter benzoatilyticus]
MSGQVFRILSIDGGGIRGAFPAHILSCIKHRLGVNIHDHFGLISGTSTGSIVAAAVARNVDPNDVVALYREHGSSIFSRKKSLLPNKVQPGVESVYDNATLKSVLKKTFGDVRLGEISVPLLMPATDIGNGGVHVFKSAYQRPEDYQRDGQVPLHEAVLASCSAPTYFDPVKVGEYLLADGGLWANNPALAAVIDTQRRLGVSLSDVRMLSLGTGHAKTCYGVKVSKGWGLLNGWKGKEFISFLMSLQAQTTNNYLQLMLRADQVLRLDFESDCALPLDDCSALDNLISKADHIFTHNSSKIRDFLA